MIPEAIQNAVRYGHIETLRSWLESGAPRDVNERLPGIFCTLLLLSSPAGAHAAGRKNRTAIQKLLLQHGADANAKAEGGITALHWCDHPEEAALLLDHGADIDALTDYDVTPLWNNVSNVDLMRLLLRRGANVFLTDNRGVDAELKASRLVAISRNAEARQIFIKAADFLAEVKAAGSWRAYWRAPRVELVHLRSLCDRGRAEPPSPRVSSGLNEHSVAEAKVFERLFGAPTRRLPNEIFWTILTFWRSSRDGPE